MIKSDGDTVLITGKDMGVGVTLELVQRIGPVDYG